MLLGAEQALQKLMEGNRRYAFANVAHPNQSSAHRILTAREPQPFAAILGCADARVPPEIIFDQGLGDLFVVRVAGNVVDDVVIGSLEYAVERFNIPLIVVLGHQECAAVTATIQGNRVGHIGNLVEAILPAIAQAKKRFGDLLENAISANVQLSVAELKAAEPLLAKLVVAGALEIVGARYALYTGMVDLID
jgi:carbonic anhydrase